MARKLKLDTSISKDIMAAASDSYIDNIKMIDISEISSSSDNFYELSGLELLADDIEREGLKHNLVVCKKDDDSGYWLKSGHRRLAAIKLLIEQNRIKSSTVPCYIDGTKSRAATRIDLIMLNATQRKYTDAELMREAEELERTFRELESEGKPLQGRMRENIAAALKISPAQVGKMENIRHNAIPEVTKAIEDGKMSISTANEIAKLSDDKQHEIAENAPNISHKEVKRLQAEEKRTSAPKTDRKEISDDLDELDNLLDDENDFDDELVVNKALILSENEAKTLLRFINTAPFGKDDNAECLREIKSRLKTLCET